MGIYYYLVAGGIVGGIALYLQRKKILKFLKGKKIAVLGERGVGKTTLVHFLSENLHLLEYEQTLEPKKVKGRSLDLKDLGSQINETLGAGSKQYKIDDLGDISGGEDSYGLWKREFDQADIILYLFFGDRLLLGDQTHIKRVKKDVEFLKAWESERNKKDGKSFFIFGIGTHCDRLKDDRWDNKEEWATFLTEFIKEASTVDVRELTGGKILLGSMKTLEDTQRLVYRLLGCFVSYLEKNL